MAKISKHQVENLIFKTGEFLKSIEPYQEAANRVKTTASAAISNYEKAIDGDLISSDNELINKLLALAKCWKSQLNGIIKKDENYWMDVSGINALNKATYSPAKEKLSNVLKNVTIVREASSGCIDMIRVINFSDHMDVKDFGQWMVSTKWLDIEARKQASQEFDDCMQMSDKVIPVLKNTLSNSIFKNS